MNKLSHFNIPVWRNRIIIIPLLNNYLLMAILLMVLYICLSKLYHIFGFLLNEYAPTPKYINPVEVFVLLMISIISLALFLSTIVLQITKHYRFGTSFSIEIAANGQYFITNLISQCPFCDSVMQLSAKEKDSRNPIFVCSSYDLHRIGFLLSSLGDVREDYKRKGKKNIKPRIKKI